MSDVDQFLSEVMPGWLAAEEALHRGDAEPRSRTWSHDDPVTLFGAWLSNSGWADVSTTFDDLAHRFSALTSSRVDIVAAGVSGDLAYTVAYEHTSTSVQDDPRTYTLRVTQVYRREGGEWKVVHRHGDELAEGQALLPGTDATIWVG